MRSLGIMAWPAGQATGGATLALVADSHRRTADAMVDSVYRSIACVRYAAGLAVWRASRDVAFQLQLTLVSGLRG